MIGRTNAGAGSGGYKNILTGTFTPDSTAEVRESFTVSGLSFEPKLLFLYIKSVSNIGAGRLTMHAFTDFVKKVGSHTNINSNLSTSVSTTAITASKSGTTYTFSHAGFAFSTNADSEDPSYGTYAYRIYG